MARLAPTGPARLSPPPVLVRAQVPGILQVPGPRAPLTGAAQPAAHEKVLMLISRAWQASPSILHSTGHRGRKEQETLWLTRNDGWWSWEHLLVLSASLSVYPRTLPGQAFRRRRLRGRRPSAGNSCRQGCRFGRGVEQGALCCRPRCDHGYGQTEVDCGFVDRGPGPSFHQLSYGTVREMAPGMTPPWSESLSAAVGHTVAATIALALPLGAGIAFGRLIEPTIGTGCRSIAWDWRPLFLPGSMASFPVLTPSPSGLFMRLRPSSPP